MPTLYPDKLAAHLDKSPAALYWIAGDDPLLTLEACDTVRQKARQQGFAERKVFFPEKHEHWDALLTEANSLSLFAARSVVDVRCALGKVHADALVAYLRNPNPDTLILLQTPKTDKKSSLYKALEPHCAVVQVFELQADRFPDWLAQRARQRGLNLAPAALSLLAEQTEGNLLAALQELDKLALRFGQASISLEQMESEVADYAHFTVFALNDALLMGDTPASLRILTILQQEGTAPLALVGSLQRELRQLAAAAEGAASGQILGPLLSRLGVWDKRQPVFQRALRRLQAPQTRRLQQRLAQVDLAVKGMHPEDPWDLLRQLCLDCCQPGSALPPLRTEN